MRGTIRIQDCSFELTRNIKRKTRNHFGIWKCILVGLLVPVSMPRWRKVFSLLSVNWNSKAWVFWVIHIRDSFPHGDNLFGVMVTMDKTICKMINWLLNPGRKIYHWLKSIKEYRRLSVDHTVACHRMSMTCKELKILRGCDL